jgi:predicted solute-binding protein
VQLARVILRERFSVEPDIVPHAPELQAMLRVADAALVIGDPALRLEPTKLPYQWLDLAGEWHSLTGLPFVFAAWAGKPGLALKVLTELTVASYHFGKELIPEIARSEAHKRGISEALANDYLRHHLWYELGAPEHKGLEEFLNLAGLGAVHV